MIATMMAMDVWLFVAFAGAVVALALTPGSDVMFTIASGLSGGRRAAIMAVFGIAAGVVTHIVIAAIGLAAVIVAHPGLLTIIQYCGAAYLVWLAVASLRAGAAEPERKGRARKGRAGALAAFRRGYITNILNPKVALFILALLPQFTTPEAGPIWHQILILGVVLVLVGTCVDMVIGLFAGAVASRLKAHQSWLDRLAALVFVGIAVRLIVPE